MPPVTQYATLPSRDMNANGGLARDVADGNPDAIEMLYVLLFRASRHMLASRLRDQDADDFLHETLAIVVEAIRNGELRNPAALPGYLKGVVRRQGAMCIVRKSTARRRQVDAGSFFATNAASDADPEADLISQERSELIQRGLGHLCQRDCELMTRFYLREQPFHQICEEMHLTETQFRLYKSRAKAKLTAWARTISHS
jgi:RNA polymerase sigma-70 factor (ECF subfamily)